MRIKSTDMRQKIFTHIKKEYNVEPEYPWSKFDTNAVFRHVDNRKWFALIMDVSREKLGLLGEEEVPVMNLKMDDPFYRDMILHEKGIIPAYHMNKMHWITVLLDGTVSEERVLELLHMSYLATASAKKSGNLRGPKDWIIPANPKYYDVVGAFAAAEEIEWKQGAGIRTGDTVFLYVAAPISAILFQCKVLETDIPYDYQDKNLTIRSLMKIRLVKRYQPTEFTFEVLKEEYGIYAIRGPRSVPEALRLDLK